MDSIIILLYLLQLAEASKVLTFDVDSYKKLNEEYDLGSKSIGAVFTIDDTKLYTSNYGDNTINVMKKDSIKMR
jgi:hypothetical protein